MAIVTSATSKTYSGFSPASVPGCVLWLDAADSNAFTLSGSNITRWNDKSPSHNDFVSAATSTSPVLSNYNGLNAVAWTGTNQQLYSLSNNATTGNALRTMFVVMHNPDAGGSQCFLVTGSETGATAAKCFGFGKNAGADYVYPFLYSAIGADIYSNIQGGITSNPTILTAVFNGSNITGWINGKRSISKATAFDTTPGVWYLGKRQQNGTGSVNSLMLELIQYSTDISATYRQQIETYLGKKWGFFSDVSSVYGRGFSPLDIPGCALWVDAADSSTLTMSGNDVVEWRDKTSNALTLSAVGTPTRGTYNGLGVVQFNGSLGGGPCLQNTGFTNTGPYAIFYMCKFDTVQSGVWQTLTDNVNGLRPFVGLDGSAMVRASMRSGGTPTTNPEIWSIQYSDSDVTKFTVNGSNVLGGSTGYGGVGHTSGFRVGLAGNSGAGLNGWIGEILVYSGTLTTSQFQRIESYFGDKWGIANSNLAKMQYRYPMPTFVRPFVPLDISGCALWLDAADLATLTFSGNEVVGWKDKSGMGYTASNIGTITTTSLNGNTVLNFGTSRMTIPNYSQYVHSTTFLVTRSATGNFIFAMNQYGTYIYLGNWDLYYFSAGGDIIQFKDTSNANGVPVVPTNEYSLVTIGYGGGSNTSVYAVNGTARSATLTGGTARPNVVISNSMFINGNTGQSFDSSQVCEILVYNNPMTRVQAQQVEGYLASKWGIRSTFPTIHPFKVLTPLTTAFTPVQIPGCIAWLDGMDPLANGTTPSNGAAVSIWKDKSGYGRDAESQAASAPTYVSASNSISFSGTVYYKLPDGTLPSGNTPYTIVIVCAPTLADYQWVFSAGQSDLRAVGLVFYPNGTLENGWWTVNVRTSAGAFTANQRAIVVGQYNRPGLYTYKDGALRASNVSLSNRDGVSSNIHIGNRFDGNPVGFVQPFAGTISEILIFNTGLSDTDRQQIEGYLSQKWNLKGALPSTHGLKTIAV